MTTSSTTEAIASLVSGIRAALESRSGVLRMDTEASARDLLKKAEQRSRLGNDFTVVAFAGSTGSGKSSLFNAVSGLEIARVGVRRPTTSKPTACVWGSGGEDILDWLEVPQENRTWRESALDGDDEEALHGLILLDLPDHDSIAQEHRTESDRLVGMVDVVLWVVDPQKYADYALHSTYLTSLAEYSDNVVVVLNQMDRLAFDERRATADHLKSLLADDGLGNAEVRLASAVTREGVPEIRELLAGTVKARDAAQERLLTDLRTTATRIRGELGEPVDDPATLTGADRLLTAMTEAAGVEATAQTVHDDYLRRAYQKTGFPILAGLQRGKADPLGSRHGSDRADLVRAAVPETSPAQSAKVSLAARELITDASQGLPLAWRDAVAEAEKTSTQELTNTLDSAVTSVHIQRETPSWWGVARFFHLLFLALIAVGVVWLIVDAVLALAVGSTASALMWAIPAGALVVGIVGSIITTVTAAGARQKGADQAAADVRSRLSDAVLSVARGSYFTPISQVLSEHKEIAERLR